MKKKISDSEPQALSGCERTKARVLSAALELLQQEGSEGVTTRAVAERAGVQPPALYRLFGDKEGLLNALAEHGFALYLPHKEQKNANHDPVEALRSGWDRHIQFGLDHPALYLLMYTRPQAVPSPALDVSCNMLRRHIEQVAIAERLRMSVDRAVALYHSAALGVVITLLRMEPGTRDLTLSSTARDYALSMIAFTEPHPSDQASLSDAASTLESSIKAEDGFSPAELGLLREWFRRFRSSRAGTL